MSSLLLCLRTRATRILICVGEEAIKTFVPVDGAGKFDGDTLGFYQISIFCTCLKVGQQIESKTESQWNLS